MMEGVALMAVQGARKRLRTTLVGRKKEVSIEDMAAREVVGWSLLTICTTHPWRGHLLKFTSA